MVWWWSWVQDRVLWLMHVCSKAAFCEVLSCVLHGRSPFTSKSLCVCVCMQFVDFGTYVCFYVCLCVKVFQCALSACVFLCLCFCVFCRPAQCAMLISISRYAHAIVTSQWPSYSRQPGLEFPPIPYIIELSPYWKIKGCVLLWTYIGHNLCHISVSRPKYNLISTVQSVVGQWDSLERFYTAIGNKT